VIGAGNYLTRRRIESNGVCGNYYPAASRTRCGSGSYGEEG